MTTLTLSDPANETLADATQIANNNAAIEAVVNGGLDSNNLKPAAGILASQISGFPNDPAKVFKGDGSWGSVGNPAWTLPPVAVLNDSAVKTLISKSIPGGTLGTSKKLRVLLAGDHFNNTAGGKPCQFVITWGGITIFDGSTGNESNFGAVRTPWGLSFNLCASNDTGHQMLTHGVGYWLESGGTLATGLSGGADRFPNAAHFVSNGTIAVDSTVAQLLVVTSKFGTASANLGLTMHDASIEVIG